jgi:hypothetical protein
MSLTVGPFGTYTDATGVVDATAAAEIVAMGVSLKSLLPSAASAFSAGAGTPVGAASEQPLPHPEFDKIAPDYAERLLVEINALLAAIAAAPAS